MTAEDYRGEATIETGDLSVTVVVRLSARFEPVEGRYRWAGRAAPTTPAASLPG